MDKSRPRASARRAGADALLLQVRAQSASLSRSACRNSVFPEDAYRRAHAALLARSLDEHRVRDAVVLVACAAETSLRLAPRVIERCGAAVAACQEREVRALFWAAVRRMAPPRRGA
ncbi:hypothetical protein ACKI2N_019780 [Cupriavidus sp. 30B13]|uniref:hypothetical protein n=1 Tax=Cupriavidus sp. 30B13 TaxID=3384241 RepID=UPI003B90EC21